MSGKRNLRRLILLFVLLCAMVMLTAVSFCAEAETKAGFVKTDDGWCYLDADGERVTGQCIIEDECYIFDESGIAKTGLINTNTGYYDYSWAIYTDGVWQQQKWKYLSSLGGSGWWYADDNGRLHDNLKGVSSIRIPSEIDSLSASFFEGITKDFIIYCEPGSYAEKYALSVGLPYDNGKKHVIGTSITDVNEKANWIIKNYIKSGMTDRQKALVLHNWLIYNAHYDYTFSYYNASGVLIQGAGVCDSYSKAYCLLLSKVGIENKRITGIATNSAGEVGGHAWTLVKVDGQWYHVDCTWDDPDDEDDASVSGYERNTYFLVGDGFIKQSRTFNDESISADNNCVGWIETGNETYYYGSDGKRATGWQTFYQDTYYFNEDGVLQIGPCEVNGIHYCFNAYGVLSTGWIEVNDKWYYADSSGIAVHNGWQQIGGVWYYFYIDGEMATGWLNDNGVYYYIEKDGSILTGWIKDKDKWYYLNDNGTLKTGWLNDSGNWYYLLSDGQMATGWICDGGAYYYMSKSGLMQTGWIENDGKWYYMNENGVMQTGWLKYRNNWYYLRSSGELASGWQQISGQWYYFTKSGTMASGEWIEDKEAEAKLPADQKRELWYWFDDNGKMAVGWKEINGQWEMFSDGGEWLYTWNGN